MELQAIRDKLQLLEAEPPAAETLSLPWSARRLIEPAQPASTNSSQQAQQRVKQSPQAIAIEALKKRSGNTLLNAQKSGHSNGAEALSQAETLIAKELYRLEIQAHNINVRSQQQAEDIINMKRAAQQAAFELSKQGIHDHPHLAAITELFDSYPSAAVPHIERDRQGHFSLTYDTIDINSAEKDAIATANALRQRAGHSSPNLFSEPILEARTESKNAHRTNSAVGVRKKHATAEKNLDGFTTAGARKQFKTSVRNMIAGFNEPASKEAHDDETGFEDFYAGNSLSWLDGAIWFSGAAIARIGMQLAVVNYAWLATPLLIGLVGTIVFVIYRVLSSKSSDYSAAYRLFIAMLGLFSVGLF